MSGLTYVWMKAVEKVRDSCLKWTRQQPNTSAMPRPIAGSPLDAYVRSQADACRKTSVC